MNKNTIKTFFWIMGVIFSGMFYYLIHNAPSLKYISETTYLPFLIIIVILALFFLVGIFMSKIPLLWYSKFKKYNLDEVLDEVEFQEKNEYVDKLVSSLKKTISLLSTSSFSEESINYLITNVGVSENYAKDIISNIKKLKKVRALSILLGLFLSIFLYLFITNYQVFTNIPKYVFSLSAIVIFILFVFEGYLVTRMPDSFYLNLIKINKKKILENKKEYLSLEDKISNYKNEQTKLLSNIENATTFLLKQNISKQAIINFFNKHNISKDVIYDFIKSSEEKIKLEKKLHKFSPKQVPSSMIKLSLKKIDESFKKINDLYQEITSLQDKIQALTKRQEKLEMISLIQDKENFIKQNKLKLPSHLKNIDVIKISKTQLNVILENKNNEYPEFIKSIYFLFLPHINKLTQNDIFTMLAYNNYPYEVIEDVLQMFKKYGYFLKENKNIFDKAVDKINYFYRFFVK